MDKRSRIFFEDFRNMNNLSEKDLLESISLLDEDREELRSKMNKLRKEFLATETKLISLNLRKEQLQEQLTKLRANR